MPVKIIQLLCPQRHCIFAMAFESQRQTDAEALALARDHWESMRADGTEPRCALCHSRKLEFDLGTTPFATMDQARPALEAAALGNALARAAILSEQSRDN